MQREQRARQCAATRIMSYLLGSMRLQVHFQAGFRGDSNKQQHHVRREILYARANKSENLISKIIDDELVAIDVIFMLKP